MQSDLNSSTEVRTHEAAQATNELNRLSEARNDRLSQLYEDEAALTGLGFAPSLKREMSAFSNFALSFSIISILTGGLTLYSHGLRYGGPLTMSVGWPIVSIMTLFVAMSLAELASAFPTAGALYHWSVRLGGIRWGFLTAWLNTIGQLAVIAGIDYGLAEFLTLMLGLPDQRIYILPIFGLVLLSHAILNHVGVRTVAVLTNVSAWYHVAAVAILVAVLMVIAPKQDVHFFFSRYTDPERSYGPYALMFAIGFLQAQWTITGYDASAHATEETVNPTQSAAWGIVLSVLVSGIVGYVMLFAITLAVPHVSEAAAAPNAFIYIMQKSLGPRLGSAMIWMAAIAMWFCGLAAVTSSSRMLFAFARDKGLPFSKQISSVSSKFKSPAIAIWTSSIGALIVGLWSQLYTVMTALSTIALCTSYAIPIALRLRARRHRVSLGEGAPELTVGSWSLGRASTAINVIAVGWCSVVFVLFIFPPNLMAGITFAASMLLLFAYWMFHQRKHFRGPEWADPTARLQPADSVPPPEPKE